MNEFERTPAIPPPGPAPHEWPLPNQRMAPRLIFIAMGMHKVPLGEKRRTTPEMLLSADRQRILAAFSDSTDGINTARAEAFVSNQGLRIAAYKLLNEDGTQQAISMKEIDERNASYKASYDVALIPRLSKVEEMHGPEFTESILVHELAHGTNTYHDMVYIEDTANAKRTILHGRSGQRVYDCNGAERGRLLEEAYAEQQRGKYVEEVLNRPFGFTKGIIKAKYLRQGDAVVAAKYAALRTSGKVHLMAESFGAQAFDLLCRADPDLEYDLRLARTSPEGLRNVAKRLNRIQPGLYAYMRDLPHQRASYKQCLISVQRLVRFLPKQKAPSFDRTLSMVGDEGLEPPTLSV